MLDKLFNIRFVETDGLGNPKKQKFPLKPREIRSMITAIVSVFSNHGLKPKNVNGEIHEEITCHLTTELVRHKNDKNEFDKFAGMASNHEGWMRVRVTKNHSDTLTVLIHEYGHLIFPEIHRDEWRISTLTNKFKPDIAFAYEFFRHTYMRQAGYIAHRLGHMAYEQNCPEQYNDRQWDNVAWCLRNAKNLLDLFAKHVRKKNEISHRKNNVIKK